MADTATDDVIEEKKGSKLPLILGLVLAILGAGGGFFAVQSGLILGGDDAEEEVAEEEAPDLPDVAFVPMDPLIVSLPPGASASYLRFSAQLEVGSEYVSEVQTFMPRIVDALNDYLRLVSVPDLQDPNKLVVIRSQLLRRAQLVVGDGRIKNLLIMEFVLD